MKNRGHYSGFTIVELLIVIVVIAILAAITIVSYNGITGQAKEAVLKQDLSSGVKQLELANAEDGRYPSNADAIKHSNGTTLQYKTASGRFCLAASSDSTSAVFHITDAGGIESGPCDVILARSGDALQTITAENCPTERIMAVDARDNRTYWVKKMPDGNCWMLTNLAYAGGGNASYGDTKTFLEGSAQAASYTEPFYYIPTNANPTTNPTPPSTSTDGGATNPQYGYLYNFCAANGGQLGTSACLSTGEPLHSGTISICPAGWRLPIAIAYGNNEFRELRDAVAEDDPNVLAGLEHQWLLQRAGARIGTSVVDQGIRMSYWGSSQVESTPNWGYAMSLYGPSSTPPGQFYTAGGMVKSVGQSVRCVAL